MYEGCLRWHDLNQICFGDIVITATYLRIFIQSAKTDAYRQGQWVTIATDTSQTAAYSLLLRIIAEISRVWQTTPDNVRVQLLNTIPAAGYAGAQADNFLPIAEVPINFKICKTTGLPDFSQRIPYQTYLRMVKTWAQAEGFPAEEIGTHNLRRGITSEWALLGIPDRLRREHGQWNSDRVADGYIDESINTHLKL